MLLRVGATGWKLEVCFLAETMGESYLAILSLSFLLCKIAILILTLLTCGELLRKSYMKKILNYKCYVD